MNHKQAYESLLDECKRYGTDRDQAREIIDDLQAKCDAMQEVVDLMLEDGSFGEEVYRNVVSKLQEIEALSKLKEQEVQGE